jgi:hypothetical protein
LYLEEFKVLSFAMIRVSPIDLIDRAFVPCPRHLHDPEIQTTRSVAGGLNATPAVPLSPIGMFARGIQVDRLPLRAVENRDTAGLLFKDKIPGIRSIVDRTDISAAINCIDYRIYSRRHIY